jgi:hypothetical protein
MKLVSSSVSKNCPDQAPTGDLRFFGAIQPAEVPERATAERDQRRLDQCRSETELAGFSDRETERFSNVFQEFLGRKRHALLFQNPIERLNAITSGMSHWIGVSRDILTRDATGARQVADRIQRHQQRFGQLLSALRSAVSGTVPQLKQELGAEVNRFLDAHSGEVFKRIDAFISGYRFAPETYSETLGAAGFSQALYQVFQEFKQALAGSSRSRSIRIFDSRLGRSVGGTRGHCRTLPRPDRRRQP